MTDELEDEFNEAELLERAAEEEPGRRGLTPRERKFIDALLGPANGDHRVAAKIVGLDETTGNTIIQRPRVQAEIAEQIKPALQQMDIDLGKDRLLRELDSALRETRAAFTKEVTAYGTCPGCGKRVPAIVRAGPKEIASLAIATSKVVESDNGGQQTQRALQSRTHHGEITAWTPGDWRDPSDTVILQPNGRKSAAFRGRSWNLGNRGTPHLWPSEDVGGR